MWRKAKVTVGDKTADQAFVDFADKTASSPEWLEWPERVDIDTAITIGTEDRFAGPAQAIGRQWHIPLMMAASARATPPIAEQIEGHARSSDEDIKQVEAAVDAAEKGPNQ